MENVQKERTMKFPAKWLCCTSKRSCESRSCDRISTYRSRKKEKCGPSAQERNMVVMMTTQLGANCQIVPKEKACSMAGGGWG